MANIRVDPAITYACATQMGDLSKKLNSFAGDVDRVRSSLRYKITGQEQIEARLREVAEQIRKEENRVRAMKSGVEQILSAYQQTEQKNRGTLIADSPKIVETADQMDKAMIMDYVKHFDFHDSKDILDLIARFGLSITSPLGRLLYQVYIDMQKSNSVAAYSNVIRDESTRDTVRENYHYGYRMMEAYNNADGKAKQVLDKYNDGIKITEARCSDGNYYSSGDDSFHLNMQNSLDDPRTAEKIFYHEYGHYVVDQNQWVYYDESGAHESESFSRFHQTLEREANAYIQDAENRARTELRTQYGSRLTEAQLESLVHKKTVEIMRSDTGNSPASKTNGISDILGSVSGSQYSLGYGHKASYWTDNWTRVGNEGFAQFFSADVNHNTVEIEFMKKHFPDAYREYQSLLDEAVG